MKFKIFLLSLFPCFLSADNFLTLKISDLSFEKESEPTAHVHNSTPYALKYSRNLGHTFLATCPTAGRRMLQKRSFHLINREEVELIFQPMTSFFVFVIRNQKFKDNSFYQKPGGWIPFSFNFEKKNNKDLSAEQKSEEAFLKYRTIRYQWLQELGVPGTAWFRHQVKKDNIRLAEIRKEPKSSQHTHNTRE